ncbi:3-isopropylmalate dehydratase large subunit [Acidaminococcus timonensis]|uniref:3-isopropylmalate dehydratase large subunit n=1 Tax=Acidaminococcus timonensis TaxID=1871002 RepID=UPI00307AA6EA
MGHTLAEKILMHHTGSADLKPGDLVIVEPDFVVVHDIYTAFLLEKLHKMGVKKVWNPDKIAIMHDHLSPACLKDDPKSLEAAYQLIEEYGIKHFHATGGIVHQLIPQLGYSKPGDIVFVTDSHTTTYGAVGCFSTGIGYTEMAAIWGTGEMWLRVPSTIRVQVDGKLPNHVYSKDIILRVLGDLKAAGATYKALEFGGSAIDALSVDERLTMSNMAVECGAKVGLFAADEKTAAYSGAEYDSVSWVRPDNDAVYEKVLRYRAEDLEPVLSCPPFVDNVHPLREVKGTKLNQVFIGSCTNGRLEDLKVAAGVLKGHKIASNIKLIVTPASNAIMEEALKRGYIQTFVEAGGVVTPPYCSFCEGRTMGLLSADEVVLGTNNRNFLGRFGSPKAKAYLSSPEVAAVSALKGEITDPRDL